MDELKQVLISHAQKYPLMQPTDAVKLLYQNEFGGGHLIKDPQACLDYLRKEYAAVEKNPEAPLYEDIGNGIIRVNLCTLREEALEKLGQAFLHSAATHTGSLTRFLEKIEVLCKLTEDGVFSFDSGALAQYLKEYEAAGYPAVSHSQAYRDAYRPAYRVIKK